jgi:hypothetical protein
LSICSRFELVELEDADDQIAAVDLKFGESVLGEPWIAIEIVDLEIASTSLSECPVKVAICGTASLARARRVTAVPRVSWKVIPLMPANVQKDKRSKS